MIPFRRILFPTDYSPACESILPWVKEMTARLSCELSLVHAWDEKAAHSTFTDVDELRVFENHRLRAWASKVLPVQHVECCAAPGEPGSVITRTIVQQGSDLVMLPTHGWGPLRRLLLGSVTAKVLHDSSAAVWTAGPDAIRKAPPYKSILCALDETAEAEGVLRAASWLAEEYDASLAIVHVVALPPASMEFDYAVYEREIVASENARMRELKGKLGIDAPHRVAGGMIASTIREEATSRNADLVVTGRGLAQENLARIWSSLYEIVREAPCAVLSI
ncbi:MAG TPA: universal stress protein [Bryobacteraceae bacterium]|nr:universal stress protein [Bryobacteraceae bacterium]